MQLGRGLVWVAALAMSRIHSFSVYPSPVSPPNQLSSECQTRTNFAFRNGALAKQQEAEHATLSADAGTVLDCPAICVGEESEYLSF